jgi:hypothetical protein
VDLPPELAVALQACGEAGFRKAGAGHGVLAHCAGAGGARSSRHPHTTKPLE